MPSWTSGVIGQALLVKREPTNPKDKNAVDFYKEDSIDIYNLPYLSRFLARDVNKTFAEVIGEKVNRGAGSCVTVYRVYGPTAYEVCMTHLPQSIIYV